MLDCFSAAITTVIFLQAVSTVFGIRCYHCTTRNVEITNEKPPPPCSNFTQTPYYEVDCSYSTFCMKRTSNLVINEKNIVTTVRGCAPQKQSEPVERNGAMVWETVVVEGAYTEGCSWTDNSHKLKINNQQICYCKNHLCNGQAKKDTSTQTDIMGIIFVYNAIKYVRSFR